MDEKSTKLIEKIKRGPAVLFLGQKYLEFGSETNNFLQDINNKYSTEKKPPYNYMTFLKNNLNTNNDIETALTWMNNRSLRMTASQSLELISGVSWSHVYTSAIDTLWVQTFRNEWREIHPIFEEKYSPFDIRNRTQLHSTFLFGSVNRTDEKERPPINRIEYLRRKQEAITLARRITEITTPMGVLIIDGFAFQDDWFSIEDFFPIIENFNTNQVHIFSAKKSDWQDTVFELLIKQDKLITHEETLSEFLSTAELNGLINLNIRPDEKIGEHYITIGKRSIPVPLDIWKQTTRSGIIIDDELLPEPKPLSKDRLYREFLTFLQDSSVLPVWSAYTRNFSFSRNYEKELGSKTQKWLENFEKHNEPIILHGQSGTGKTVALGKLAYDVKTTGIYPVLFIERKSIKPTYADIDVFCKWVEDNGGDCTLLIWDGMLDSDQYFDLLTFLLSRGRKIVLVGSCYRKSDEEKKKYSKKGDCYIEAPSLLSHDEFSALIDYLKEIDPDINLDFLKSTTKVESSFFVTLYRLLPSTRAKLKMQLNMEVSVAEKRILLDATKKNLAPSLPTLGYALWKAKLIDIENPLQTIVKTIDGEELNRLEYLIGLIMVPGQFGINVPISILVRAIKSEWLENLDENLHSDIFRTHEDNIGNILIGPRHPLEAKLIVQTRLGGIKNELDFIRQLILEVRGNDFQDGLDIQFAVDLIRSIGPNGQDPTRYSLYFRDISTFLTELREERGIVSPRLMLQEATLLREYVSLQDKKDIPMVDSYELLNKAEIILKTALATIEKEHRNDKQKSTILVELAATLASKNVKLVNPMIYQEAKDYLYKAKILFSEDFHPIDVIIWMSGDILKSNTLPPEKESEIKADLLFLLSSIDVDSLLPNQLEKYYQKQDYIAELLNDTQLSESSLNSLASIGSKAGYLITASKITGKLPHGEIFDEEQISKIGNAVNYLQTNIDNISKDGRCVSLLFRLWWLFKTHKPIFFGERQTVRFSDTDWLNVWDQTNTLIQFGGIYSPPSIKFINAMATFQLNQIENALELFRNLERESENLMGKRRILKSYLYSTTDGKPKEFHGQVAWISDNRERGEVFVEELRRNIQFLPLVFHSGRSITRGDSLETFHIAFNFIGALAEPKSLYKTK